VGLLSADEWTEMAADLAEARADNPVAIVIRRGATTLASQTVRLTGTGRAGAQMVGNRTEQARGSVLVLGATTLDIQPGDRFNDAAGLLYEVTLVKPNRKVGTVAEAMVAE
jgi:hypothetical protein